MSYHAFTSAHIDGINSLCKLCRLLTTLLLFLTVMPSKFAKCQGERHADEESSEDEWSDAEDTDTPIDCIDPFVVFADTVKQLQTSASPRFQVLVLA